MKGKFTKIMAALALLVFMIPFTGWGQSTVTFDATTDITDDAQAYQTDVLTINAADGSVWTATGYGATANTNIVIGKGGANYLKTPVVEGTITSVAVTWSGNTNYYLALQTTSGTELEAKSNPSEPTTETYTVSGNYSQLQLVGRRNSGTSNAAATITNVVVTYTPGSVPQPDTYTVSFDAGEGTFDGNDDFPEASNEVEAGIYSLPSATREGYTMLWSDGEDTYEAGADYEVTEDVDFTAQWTENTTPTPQGSTDVLNRAFTGYTSGTSYYDWSGKTGTSGAVYAGNSAGGNESIQLRTTNSNSGIITTTSGGKVTKVVVTWGSGNTNGRSLDIYGKNDAYTAPTDLYNSSEQGTKLGSIVVGGSSTTLNITGNYTFIGLRSSSGAMYLAEIDITWVAGEDPSVATSVTIDATGITNTDVYTSTTAGSLSATVKDNENNTISGASVTWSSSNAAVATVDANGAVTLVHAGSAVITASYEGVENQYKPSTGTYELTVTNSDPNPAGTQTNPYNVAQARASIDANYGITNVYATGIVSEIVTAYDSEFGNVTFDIVDEAGNATTLRAYRCGGDYADEVAVNDVVIILGDLTKYNNTYEFTQGCEIVSLTHPSYPIIEVEEESVTLDYNATSGSIAYSIQNVENAIATATSNASWLTIGTISATTVALSCSVNNGNEDRTATVTLSYEGAENVTITVTQGHYMAPGNWVLTDLADLTDSDVFVIVGTDGDTDKSYAMTNDRGASNAPLAIEVNVVEGTLSGEIADNIQWNISGDAEGYTFYPNGDADKWLYNIPSNAKCAVGTNDNKTYVFDSDYGYLKHVGTNKYIGIYFGTTPDWRGYVLSDQGSIQSNIQNQTIAFYKKVEPETESYELTINGYTDAESKAGYYLIASPVTVNIADVDGLTEGDFDLYSYDESQELEWINYKQEDGSHPFTTLEPGKGYLYAKKATAETSTYTFTLTGTPYCGTSIVLSKQSTGTLAGWNLIGNPLATSNIAPGRAFYIMNSTIGELIVSESNTVEPKQGFFVIAEEDDEVFELTVPLGGDGNLDKLVMNLSQNRGTVIDRAIVRFGEGEQLPKFQLFESSTKLYIPMGASDYAIVRSAAEGEMPVNFKAKENGTYTISVNTENVEMDYLHLIDNMTGTDVDLLATPSYTFEATTRDYASRFRLVFSANEMDGPSTGSGSFAYFNGSEWQISNIGEATLQVVDVMGRVVKNVALEGNATVSINEMPGVYMMRLLNGNDVKVQKVVIR